MTLAALQTIGLVVSLLRIFTNAQFSEWEVVAKGKIVVIKHFSSFADDLMIDLKEKEACYTEEACLVHVKMLLL